MLSVTKLTGTHRTKKLQIFFYTAITIRTILPRLLKVAPFGMNFIGCLAVDIRFAMLD